MNNKKLKALFTITLICTLIIGLPIISDAACKSKKIGKPEMDIRTFSSFISRTYENNTAYCLGDCEGAKKVEFYRSKTKSGRYKKVATIKEGRSKQVKNPNGLYFYKARGINGKKKGKFCKVEATYNVDISLVSATLNKSDRTMLVKFLVDNTGAKNDIILTDKSSAPTLSTIIGLDNTGTDYAGQDATGKFVDANGNLIGTQTIARNSKDYVYVKYSYEFSETLEYTDAEIDRQLDYSKKAMDAAISGKADYEYNTELSLQYKVMSKGKAYKFVSTVHKTDYDSEGYTFSGWI